MPGPGSYRESRDGGELHQATFCALGAYSGELCGEPAESNSSNDQIYRSAFDAGAAVLRFDH
jgi:hypothetical protein